MEEQVKSLIRDSICRRLDGHDDIDNILPNESLIEQWVTAIAALGYNDGDVKSAAADINELQSQILGDASIEDTRAFVYLAHDRFADEVAAFSKYVELRNSEPEDAVIYAVEEELRYVEQGDFMIS